MGSCEVLVEREPERELLRGTWVAARASRGRIVVLRSAPGLGRSALLDEAATQARSDGATVLVVRADGLEPDVPLGLARRLLAPLVHDEHSRRALLTGDAALAAPVFSPTWFGAGADGAVGLQEGLCSLVLAAAAASLDAGGGPLVLVADDVQWADESSLRLLVALSARVADRPVAVLCGRGPSPTGPSSALLDLLEAGPDTTVRDLRPLTPAGAAALGRTVLGPGASETIVGDCVERARGNPSFLRVLLREAAEAGTTSGGSRGDRVPEAIVRSVGVHLTRLPDGARSLAEAMAVLGEGAATSVVTALAGLDDRALVPACDALAAGAIIETDDPLRFAHPLVASAVAEGIAPFARAALHHQAARLLREADAPTDVVAAHLLGSPPSGDERAALLLLDAARSARVGGRPTAATTLLERALAEQPSPTVRAAVLVELAGVDIRLGSAAAAARLEEALDLLADPVGQAKALAAHGAVLHHSGAVDDAVATYRRGLALVPDDSAVGVRLRSGLVGSGLHSSTLVDAAREEVTHLLDAEDADTDLAPGRWAQLAILAAERGDPDDDVRVLAERALHSLTEDAYDPTGVDLGYAVQALIWVDALEQAETHLVAAEAVALRTGSFMSLAVARLNRALVALHQGRLADAVRAAELASEVQRHGWTGSAWSAPVLAVTHVERGDLAAARAAIALGERAKDQAGPGHGLLVEARARVHLAAGDDAAALADAVTVGALREERFGSRCERLFRWRVVAATASARLGRAAEAEAFLEPALDEAHRLGTPRQLAESLTVAGRLTGGPAGLLLLEEAVDVLETSPSHLQRAHSLAALGGALRREGRRHDALEPLARSLELADGMGALPLVAQVRHELGLLGTRPRRTARSGPAALTPAERAIADLAASGLGNVQIGRQLFVSRKTVESHLASTYRKLGIRSRHELADALGDDAS